SHTVSGGGSSRSFVSTTSVTLSDGSASLSGGGAGDENVTPRIRTPCASAARNSIELSRSALIRADRASGFSDRVAACSGVCDDMPLLSAACDEPPMHLVGRLDLAVRVDAQRRIDIERVREIGRAHV